ncbi:MAG: cadherin domain-containing protein [Hyphomonadaceae bacterium]|nr:cadherin domain-containing protein [Hyphomonadaceae bacterium]
MTDFLTLNASSAVRDLVNGLRRSVSAASQGLARVQAHHIGSIAVVGVNGTLKDNLAARAVLLLDTEVRRLRTLDLPELQGLGINGADNLIVLSDGSPSSDLSVQEGATHNGGHSSQYYTYYSQRLDTELSKPRYDSVRAILSNADQFQRALLPGPGVHNSQLTSNERALLAEAIDRVNWEFRHGLRQDVTPTRIEDLGRTLYLNQSDPRLAAHATALGMTPSALFEAQYARLQTFGAIDYDTPMSALPDLSTISDPALRAQLEADRSARAGMETMRVIWGNAPEIAGLDPRTIMVLDVDGQTRVTWRTWADHVLSNKASTQPGQVRPTNDQVRVAMTIVELDERIGAAHLTLRPGSALLGGVANAADRADLLRMALTNPAAAAQMVAIETALEVGAKPAVKGVLIGLGFAAEEAESLAGKVAGGFFKFAGAAGLVYTGAQYGGTATALIRGDIQFDGFRIPFVEPVPQQFDGAGYLAQLGMDAVSAAVANGASASAPLPANSNAPRPYVLNLAGLPTYDANFLKDVILPSDGRYSLVTMDGRPVVIETATRIPVTVILMAPKNNPGEPTYNANNGTGITPAFIISPSAGYVVRIDFESGSNSGGELLTRLVGAEAAAQLTGKTLYAQFDSEGAANAFMSRAARGEVPELEVGRDGVTDTRIVSHAEAAGIANIAQERFENAQNTMAPLIAAAPALISPLERIANRLVGSLESFLEEARGALASIRIDLSTVLAVVGSVLGRQLAGSNPFAQVAVSSALSTALAQIGEALSDSGGSASGDGPEYIGAQFSSDFWRTLRAQGINSISTYLISEIAEGLGLDGDVGDLGISTGAAAIAQIANNLVGSNVLHIFQNGQWTPYRDAANNVFAQTPTANVQGLNLAEGTQTKWATRPWHLDLKVSVVTAVASFLGGKLADSIIQFDTVGGQIGAAIGAGIGTAIAGKMLLASLNPGTFLVAVAIIAALKIFGGLVGSLFGGKPKSGADLTWNSSRGQFQISSVWSKNGGSKDAARGFAESVGDLLNAVISVSGASVADPLSIRLGAYGVWGKDFVYWDTRGPDAGRITFRTRSTTELVSHGQFIALSDIAPRLIGGDVFVKRAVAATLEHGASAILGQDFDVNVLSGNIAIARDFRNYLQHQDDVHAFIALNPQSANSVSWLASMASAHELGIDRRASSDWNGGWFALLDEAVDGALDGVSFAAANLDAILDPTTAERLFYFIDSDGEALGALSDTIDIRAKLIIEAGGGADSISLVRQTWTEQVAQISAAGVDAVTGAVVPESTSQVAVPVSGWRIGNSTGLAVNGMVANGDPIVIDVAAYIDGGLGNDTISGGDLGNDLLGSEGDDTLVGGKLDDWLFGGVGNDRLFAGAANFAFTDTVFAGETAAIIAATSVDAGNGDLLDGGDGDDRLYGGRGSDWLKGGAGVDVLIGGAGGDIIEGGAGDDRGVNGEAFLRGGAGSDQYVFSFGDGVDVVFDASDSASVAGSGLYAVNARYAFLGQNPGARNWAGDGDYEVDGSVVGGEDAIAFGIGIGFEDLRLQRGAANGVANSDLIVQLTALDANGQRVTIGDSLTIKDWFDETRRVEWLRFADGQDIRIGDISSFIVGSDLHDTIIGTDGADWVVGLGGGDDIKLLSGDDFGFGGKGNDIIAGDGNNDFLSGGDDADQIMGGLGNDTAFGDAGNDVVSGDDGNDIIAGGRGDDAVNGGAGDDLYRFWRGDGHDTVSDSNPSSTTEDVYANGQWVNGYTLDDLLSGGDWAVSLQWDAATQRFKRRDGAAATGNAGQDDMLEFGFGIDMEDVQVRKAGGDLELAIGAGAFDASAFMAIHDRITFTQWFSGVKVEHLVFTEVGDLNVASWNIAADANGATATDGDDVIAGTDGIDWYTGGLGDDTLSGAGGDDILSGNRGADFISGGEGADIIFGGGENDVLDGGNGADQMFGGDGEDFASYASSAAGIRISIAHEETNTLDGSGDTLIGIEGVEGSNFADQLSGDASDNVLRGLGGNDLLKGDSGDDTYEVNASDGDDVIADYDVNFEEIVDANGLLNPSYQLTWELVDIADLYGVYWYRYRLTVTRASDNEVLYSSRLNDFKYTTEVSEAPPPASWPFSNGQWASGVGRTGNSAQTVLDRAGAGNAGDDVLELGPNLSLADLTASVENNGADLKISFAGGSVTVKDHFYLNGVERERAVENLILADGLAASLVNIKLPGAGTGTTDDDLYLGAASADSFAGGEGDDVISGGAGADTLLGEAGDDMLEGGAGGDVLDGGSDSITLDHAALQGDMLAAYGDAVRYLGSTAGVTIDLVARSATGGDATGDTIAAFMTAEGQSVSSIENVMGSQGYADNLYGDDRANRLAGFGGGDYLDGRGGDDILVGGDGVDTLRGGAGADGLTGGADADTLFGEDGADIIDGGDGADTIAGGLGADMLLGGVANDIIHGDGDADEVAGGDGLDTLYGDTGDDVIDGGADADAVYGGEGDDAITGGAGDDVLRGEAGDDAYVFDATSGVDQIVDAVGVSNSIAITGVAFDKIWLAHSGDDLVISVIGATSQITVTNYFAATGASLMRSIVTDDHTLFLNTAEPFIQAMTAASPIPPAVVPTSVSDMFATYWHLGQKSAPQTVDQTLTASEDLALTGQVGAVDHDGETMTYAILAGPAHGALALDAQTGGWTYTPSADWSGADGFDVRVTDASNQSVTQHVAVTVAPINDAPTVAGGPFSVNENVVTGTIVGALSASDVEGGAITFVAGSNAGGRFAVGASGEITVAAGTLLDFEAGASFQVSVAATDAGGATTPYTVTITLNDQNEAPTTLSLANTTTVLAEDASTADRIKVADLLIGDDALGVESITLTGADAASFEVIGASLYLKAGLALNHEAKTSYAVTVNVDDPSVGAGPDLSQELTVAVADVNEAPAALNLVNATPQISESASTAARTKVADLVVIDDALGSEALGLTGTDAASFEIINGALYLRADVALNFETKPSYSVTVTVDDPTLGTGAELSQVFTLAVLDGNEAPTGLSFTNATTSFAENTSTASRVKVADLVVNDDALGTVVFGLSGTGATAFEIVSGALYLKAGVSLNYEAQQSYAVTVTVDDPSLGAGVELSESLTLFITDVNEAPSALAYVNTTASLAENTSTASRIKVADLVVTDDALGSEMLGVTGADAASFEIVDGALYLKAGVALNYETKTVYSVNVTVDDNAVGGAPDVSQAFTLSVTGVNEAPTSISAGVLTIAENSANGAAVGTFTRVDPDVGDTASYSLQDNAGGRFGINTSTGALTVANSSLLNYEAAQSHNVTVRVTDAGGLWRDQSFAVSVANVNEAPTTPTSLAGGVLILPESGPFGGYMINRLSATDPDGSSPTFSVSYDPFQVAEVVGNELRTRTTLNIGFDYWYNWLSANPRSDLIVSDFDGDGVKEMSWSLGVAAADGSLSSLTSAWSWLSIEDTNQAPVITGATVNVSEATPGGGSGGALWTFAWSDYDTQSYNRDPRFAITDANGNAVSTPFSINATTGQLFLQGALNYEAQNQYAFYIQITDRAGAGLSHRAPVTVNVTNANEAPSVSVATVNQTFQGGAAANTIIGTTTPIDPDGATTFTFSVSGGSHSYTVNSSGQLRLASAVEDGTYEIENVVVSFTDPGGLTGYQTYKIKYNYAYRFLPVVLDLDGDGLELVSFQTSTIAFDMDGDGVDDATGWVGADDGLLVFDRNGNGLIDDGSEISFANDLSGAVSDVEGLRAFDTNVDGFFDANDAQFSAFQIWRDANQDGVSQTGELSALNQAGVVAINLTLNLTGASAENASDNVVYATTEYVRSNGTVGTVGDVVLAYGPIASGGLPPIVLDLDGNGISLTSRGVSTIGFDADGDGKLEHIGWFGAGEGVLALDRNGDGLIAEGSEISFAQDLEGARTDLEGLSAYDSNENGFFDADDGRYGEFRIWRDANQDGVSQGTELLALSDWNVVAINLTPSLTGASINGASDNVIYATTQFVRADGTTGVVGDVYLSFDENGVTITPDSQEGSGVLPPGGDQTPAGGWCGTPVKTGDGKPPVTSIGNQDPSDGPLGIYPPFGEDLALSSGWDERGRGRFLDAGTQPVSGGTGAGDPAIGNVDRQAQGHNGQRQAQAGEPSDSGMAFDPPIQGRGRRGLAAEPGPFASVDPDDQGAFDAVDRLREARANRVDAWLRPLPGSGPLMADDGHAFGEDWTSDERFSSTLAGDYANDPRGALHAALGMADRTVLHMIDAMAAFDIQAGIETGSRQMRDHRGHRNALLTSLPQVK